MIVLRLLPIFFTLLFILSRRTNIRVTKSEELTVKINFNIFAIVLSEEKIKKRGLKKLPKLLKNAKGILKSLDYLVSKSEVRIIKCKIPDSADKKFHVIRNAYFLASTQLLISYLERNCKKILYIDQENYYKILDNTAALDLSLHFPFYYLIISALLFLYYIVKNNVKRVLNSV